jgi:putative addiction module component (TIGR02574 family)
MTAEKVKALPTTEKLQLMEALWEDLRIHFEQAEIPPRVRDLLDARRARVRAGSVQVLDWEAVKATIGGR